jgi:hypothetical protein
MTSRLPKQHGLPVQQELVSPNLGVEKWFEQGQHLEYM